MLAVIVAVVAALRSTTTTTSGARTSRFTRTPRSRAQRVDARLRTGRFSFWQGQSNCVSARSTLDTRSEAKCGEVRATQRCRSLKGLAPHPPSQRACRLKPSALLRRDYVANPLRGKERVGRIGSSSAFAPKTTLPAWLAEVRLTSARAKAAVISSPPGVGRPECREGGSSGRTRTYNPPVNSRMLCH